MTATIYALRDPRTDAIRYIGQTAMKLGRRVSGHLASARFAPAESKVRTWLLDLMSIHLSPLSEVLEVVPAALGDAAEIMWIAQHRQIGANLLNQSRGGRDTTGVVRSAEYRARVGQWAHGQWKNDRAKMLLAANTGRGEQFLEKQRAAGLKRGADRAYTKKISDSQRRRLASRNTLVDADIARIRALLAAGQSQRSIAKQYDVNPCEISRIHTGKRWKHVAQ